MYSPIVDTILEMDPIEFERYSLELLKSQTKELNKVKIEHNKIMEVDDGSYQLDGYIEFEVMGVMYKTIVECKHWKNSIGRDVIQKVYSNLCAIGAQKGIVISTSNFQAGAVRFASKHGIALIQLTKSSETIYAGRGGKVVTGGLPGFFRKESPYIGVLVGQGKDGDSVTHAYLTPLSDEIYKFMLR